MDIHPLTILGFLIINLGFWPVFIAIGRRKGLGSSGASMRRGWAALSQPAPGLETITLRVGPIAIILGALLCFGGVFLGDVASGSSCRSACEVAGYDGGRLRGSPHVERSETTPRACWCYKGRGKAQTWSPEAIVLPAKAD